jgi:hypothetical protein
MTQTIKATEIWGTRCGELSELKIVRHDRKNGMVDWFEVKNAELPELKRVMGIM